MLDLGYRDEKFDPRKYRPIAAGELPRRLQRAYFHADLPLLLIYNSQYPFCLAGKFKAANHSAFRQDHGDFV
jgi:hypothetical protein